MGMEIVLVLFTLPSIPSPFKRILVKVNQQPRSMETNVIAFHKAQLSFK
jgi:hypothetical protein